MACTRPNSRSPGLVSGSVGLHDPGAAQTGRTVWHAARSVATGAHRKHCLCDRFLSVGLFTGGAVPPPGCGARYWGLFHGCDWRAGDGRGRICMPTGARDGFTREQSAARWLSS